MIIVFCLKVLFSYYLVCAVVALAYVAAFRIVAHVLGRIAGTKFGRFEG